MNREQAEAAARKGAKVRRGWWDEGDFVTFKDGGFVTESGGKYDEWPFTDDSDKTWSVVEPAPTAEPDLAEPPVTRAEFDALAEEFHRHFHMTDPREDRTTTQYQPPEPGWPTPNAATREALDDVAAGRVARFETFDALMADLEGQEVMSDEAIRDAVLYLADHPDLLADNAIRLTRASVIAEIEASGTAKAIVDAVMSANSELGAIDAVSEIILSAVRK
jgi:hypothetical protein